MLNLNLNSLPISGFLIGFNIWLMAYMNDTKANLGLVADTTNQWQNSNMAAGAGANANPRVDMMPFVGSDTLAELVWSPQTGLSIKFVEKKPCFMLDVGTSDISGSQHQRASEQFSNQVSEEEMASRVDESDSDIKSALKIEPLTKCEPQEHVEKGNVTIEKDGCFNDPFLENTQHEKHMVDSHGSMESCKSGNLLTKRKRRVSFEQQLVLGTRRIKKQRKVDNDVSFMNWISNMLKGLKSHENQSVYDKTPSLESRKMGFQSVFLSLGLPHEPITQADKCSHESLDLINIKKKEVKGVVKRISLYERVTKEAPKDIFDTIRRLRLSRTDILKWTNSGLPFAHLDGYFLRLRVAKWAEGAGGSRYYVACITGLQGENPWRGLKQPIPVKVGGVECLVESQYVSNCDFLEDELVTWWQKASTNKGTRFVKDLNSKLAERKTLDANEQTTHQEQSKALTTPIADRRCELNFDPNELNTTLIDFAFSLHISKSTSFVPIQASFQANLKLLGISHSPVGKGLIL
ncbi:unnamed protein product [Lactuca saligna]|uniref:Plus3 domain-containing protein n=1 Tax=Lactuca saligna TaxID=75948 RepID=A0AA36DZY4_LACSI|nr:unnamed protein product [Lactuca saligna]